MTDTELLQRYISESSHEAFNQLARRHLDFIYASALRQTRSTVLAAEVAQAVLIDLARSARRLRSDTHLPSWLSVVTRRTAIDAIRRESRRQTREQISAELAAVNGPHTGQYPASDFAPVLDDALNALSESDRRAVLLRFFENQSLKAIAQHFRSSEDSAQKRVSRALDKLRTQLARRGIATSAALLAAQLPLHASAPAPAFLAAAISSPTFFAATAAVPAASGLLHAFLMITTHKTVLTTAFLLSLATVAYQARSLADRNEYLGSVENALAAARAEIARLETLLTPASALPPPPEPAPLSPTEQRLRTLLARVEKLKAVFDLTPEEKIPELAYLTENDWISAAMTRSFENAGDFELAQASLRSSAKYNFAPRIQAALFKYAAVSGGQLPTSTAQLLPFFEPAIDPAILDRYEMTATGLLSELGPEVFVISEIPGAFFDSPVDRRIDIAPRFISSRDMPEIARKQAIFESRQRPPLPDYLQIAFNEARSAFRAAHGGDESNGIDSLRPYYKNPEHAEKVYRYYTSRDPETGEPIEE